MQETAKRCEKRRESATGFESDDREFESLRAPELNQALNTLKSRGFDGKIGICVIDRQFFCCLTISASSVQMSVLHYDPSESLKKTPNQVSPLIRPLPGIPSDLKV